MDLQNITESEDFIEVRAKSILVTYESFEEFYFSKLFVIK